MRIQHERIWTKPFLIFAASILVVWIFWILPVLSKIPSSPAYVPSFSSAKEQMVKTRYAKQLGFLRNLAAESTASTRGEFIKEQHRRKAERLFKKYPEIVEVWIKPGPEKGSSYAKLEFEEPNYASNNSFYYYSEYVKNANGNYVKIGMNIAKGEVDLKRK